MGAPLPEGRWGLVANPKYGTTVPNAGTALGIQVDKKVRDFWVESVDGAERVWFTVNGEDPIAGTDGVYFLPAAAGAGIPFSLPAATQVTVKFKSTGAVWVSVRYL